LKYGLADGYRYQMFLSVSLLSMGLTPLLISLGPSIVSWLLKLPFPKHMKSGLSAQSHADKPTLHDHVIIVGFGLNGRHLALSAKRAGIPYIIIEMNPETVMEEKKKGEPIYFGDATHESVLRHLGIERARVATVVINDIAASSRIVDLMRRMNSELYILVRTRYFQQMNAFYSVGATDVIPDELGTSIEIFSRVLELFQIPQAKIDDTINDIRKNLYTNLRLFHKHDTTLYDLKFGHRNLGIESIHIESHNQWVGKTILEAGLRKEHGVTVVAIKRCGEVIYDINADTTIYEDDIITVTGDQKHIKAMKDFLIAPTAV
jgi:CPA2 family monovalent cation:H+ antiporter-2